MGDHLLAALVIVALLVLGGAIGWALTAHAGHLDDQDGRGD